ncbi:uncharacterized protein LOC102706595 [Oryza brachyantha]|uniref:uncharacterized protein LOC102706595 n=1 Tax=Oryza brachyantha TaxID=4533 RepID=UPI0003EA94AD|nr:uncharacterized protein LOC102706595 [Oryza brachyantha]
MLGLSVVFALVAPVHGQGCKHFYGVATTVYSICMYASALSIMRPEIKTKSMEYMPFLLSLGGFPRQHVLVHLRSRTGVGAWEGFLGNGMDMVSPCSSPYNSLIYGYSKPFEVDPNGMIRAMATLLRGRITMPGQASS